MKSDAEFLKMAMNNYDNFHCHSVSDFKEDITRFSSVKKMLVRYKTTKEINVRLVLNHAVVIFNVFGNAGLDLFLYKIPREHHPTLFPFLLVLNRLTEDFLIKQRVDLDLKILQELKKL